MDKKNLPLFFFIVFWVFLISFIHLIFVLSCLLHVWVTIVTMLKRWFYPCDCIGASSKGAVHKNPHCAFTFVAPLPPTPPHGCPSTIMMNRSAAQKKKGWGPLPEKNVLKSSWKTKWGTCTTQKPQIGFCSVCLRITSPPPQKGLSFTPWWPIQCITFCMASY